mgnify:CR=1 FL=1
MFQVLSNNCEYEYNYILSILYLVILCSTRQSLLSLLKIIWFLFFSLFQYAFCNLFIPLWIIVISESSYSKSCVSDFDCGGVTGMICNYIIGHNDTGSYGTTAGYMADGYCDCGSGYYFDIAINTCASGRIFKCLYRHNKGKTFPFKYVVEMIIMFILTSLRLFDDIYLS